MTPEGILPMREVLPQAFGREDLDRAEAARDQAGDRQSVPGSVPAAEDEWTEKEERG
jgi:hypothetical protein